jgi:hypothetical protein
MQDLSKDDRVEWPKLISEFLFIHHNSLMNSILFQGFNRFSPYHEISKYLQDFAQENGKFRCLEYIQALLLQYIHMYVDKFLAFF